MKIPFDIKYRPEIEAGKYKIITVGDNKPVRIICWDRKSFYKPDGQYIIYLVDLGREEVCFNFPCEECAKSLEIVIDEPELTEFEKVLRDEFFCSGDIVAGPKFIRERAKYLLELAQKELENSDWIKDIREWCYNKGHLEGYAKGQEDAEKRHKEATSYHFPMFGSFMPPCYVGGPCTNPHHDCINCPRQGATGLHTTDTNIK